MKEEVVAIDGSMITLGQLLKHLNLISSGGMAKWFLSNHQVWVDGQLESRRGKKLFDNTSVIIEDIGHYIVAASPVEER